MRATRHGVMGEGGGGNNTGGGDIVIRATVESFGRKMWCTTCQYSKITSSPVPALSFSTTHYSQGQRDQSNCQLMCDTTNAITLQSLFETSRNYITLKLFYSNTLSSQRCRRSQSYHGKTRCFINNYHPHLPPTLQSGITVTYSHPWVRYVSVSNNKLWLYLLRHSSHY